MSDCTMALGQSVEAVGYRYLIDGKWFLDTMCLRHYYQNKFADEHEYVQPEALMTVEQHAALVSNLAAERDRLRADVEALQAQLASKAATDVLAERRRQVEAEGWTPEHDDEHSGSELADAASCYSLAAAWWPDNVSTARWPWDEAWWKPSTPRRMLVKAGALIIAEIERLDRAAMAAKEGA